LRKYGRAYDRFGLIGICSDVRSATARAPKAEVHPRSCYVANVPKAVVSRCSNCVSGKAELFDHLIGAGQECLWDREAERLGRVEIDDEIELGWLLDRNFGGFSPAQNLVHHGTTRFEFGRLWLVRGAPDRPSAPGHPDIPGHPNAWMLVWRRRAPEWDPRTRWAGSDKPGMYWRRCAARLERARGVDPEDARCRFPKCDCWRELPEQRREEWDRAAKEWERRRAEGTAYKERWKQKLERELAERAGSTGLPQWRPPPH
jgi:hypothetical protein